MAKRTRGIICAALVCALVCGTSATAAVVVPLPGLSGPGLTIVAAQRTDTGGGVILAFHSGTVTLARVESDGAPDLAYGTLGLTQLDTPGDFTPTALAVDPGSGTAWVGGSTGTRAEIFAVAGTGAALISFGTHGALTLPAAIVGVRSLAWRAGALLVMGVNPECDGCQLTELSPASGRRLAEGTLSPGQLVGTCSAVRGTGAVWSQSNIVVATTQAGPRCRAQTLFLVAPLSNHESSVSASVPVSAGSIRLAAAGGQICEGGQGRSGVSLWGAGQSRATQLSRHGDASLEAIVPIGGTACGALVRVPGAGFQVFQIASGGAAAAQTAVPDDFRAMTMYRCNAHLLVLGTVQDAAEILAVPLAEGPNVAHRISRRSFARVAARSPTTGCT